MTKQWLKDHKQDSYYKRAKIEGYRSRAAYKLMEIHKRFRLFRLGYIVLDLGAAPGGWSQVATKLVGKTGMVIGIDLSPIKPLINENTIFIKGDMTDNSVIEQIKKITNNAPINIVLSDAAPNISGNYSVDQAKSIYLAENAIYIAEQVLAKNGKLVVKVFEGQDFQNFIKRVKEKFRKYRIFSPKASRARSSEVYIIGEGFM